jgi:spectinomycin phosphotransferase/16S rRNA (guanine(1405)-N(7))-methyltransferase
VLAAAVERGWGLRVASMRYLAVGWGSHHWEVAAGGGGRWFVTVDEVANKRVNGSESLDDGFGRLLASLRAAGCEFVVAPAPAGHGEPVLQLGERFAVAVYPFVDGESFAWGEVSAEWRLGMLEMVAAVHRAPVRALAEGFAVPFRDQLEAACAGRVEDHGPYAQRVAALCRARPCGPHPRRAASGEHDADRRRLAAHRLGHRAGGAARTRPLGPRPRRRINPGRLRVRDRRHASAGTPGALPAGLGRQGHGL